MLQGTIACEEWARIGACGTASLCPAAEASVRWRAFVAIGAAWMDVVGMELPAKLLGNGGVGHSFDVGGCDGVFIVSQKSSLMFNWT